MAHDVAHPLVEESGVAAQLVDGEAPDHCRVGRVEHRLRARHRRDDPAAVDVREQAHRHLGAAGEAHVGDVACPQIGLRRAPRPLDDHEVVPARKALEALHHRREQPVPRRHVVGRAQGRGRAPVHHHLGDPVALGLEQHRVHVHAGRESRRARLQRLGAPDLAPLRTGRRVVRHVLGLEGSDGDAAPARDPAQARDHRGLAGVRAGALDHQRPAPHGAVGPAFTRAPQG